MYVMAKKIFLYSIIVGLCVLQCMGDSELDIAFIQQPVGGKNVTLLACTFEGKLLDGTAPITVSIEWWSTDSSGNNEQREHGSTYTFESISAKQVGAELIAPASEVFKGYYWLRIEWQSSDNTTYSEESNKAFCYEGPNNQ